MKFTNLILLVAGILFLNPRLDLQGIKGSPKYIVSCSTGWSLQWGKGLLGIYSLEASSENRLSSIQQIFNNKQYLSFHPTSHKQKAKERIMRPCKQ